MAKKEIDAKENNKEKAVSKADAEKADKMKKYMMWAGAFVVVFIIAVFAFKAFGIGSTRTYVVDGMTIQTDSNADPAIGLASILSINPQIVRIEVYNGSDSRNSEVAIIAAEAIRAIAYSNRTVSGYVAVYNPNDTSTSPALLNCNANNSHCGTPTITVRYGTCDCMKVEESQNLLVIEGDSTFAANDLPKVNGMIAMVEAQIANQTAK